MMMMVIDYDDHDRGNDDNGLPMVGDLLVVVTRHREKLSPK